jgi:hypothetical protein
MEQFSNLDSRHLRQVVHGLSSEEAPHMYRLGLRELDATIAKSSVANIPADEASGDNEGELVKQDDRTVRVP